MKRRTAIWSIIVGWLCSLFGWPKKSSAVPIEKMQFVAEKIEYGRAYFRMRVDNATGATVKPVLDAAYEQGWFVYSMCAPNRNRSNWHQPTTWDLCFYRPARMAHFGF